MLARVVSKVVDRIGDLVLGIKTRSFMSAQSLGYASAELNDYAAVPYLELRPIFSAIPRELLQGAFIDYGCGLGRVLVVASRRGFSRVIGVELAESLVVEGRKNLGRYPKCEIVHSDATAYVVPADATVFYFANPFGGKPLQDTLLQIAKSVAQAPRPHLIVGYNNAAKLPRAAADASITLRQVEYRQPAHGKVWAAWQIE
jgi:SAM-dependent methyltransferase